MNHSTAVRVNNYRQNNIDQIRKAGRSGLNIYKIISQSDQLKVPLKKWLHPASQLKEL